MPVTLGTAPGLQEQRFVNAQTITTLLTYVPEDQNEEDKQNENGLGTFGSKPRLTSDLLASYQESQHKSRQASIISKFHPCLFKMATHPWMRAVNEEPRTFDPSNPPTALFFGCEETSISILPHKMLSWPKGPWEDMLVSQPPCDFKEFYVHSVPSVCG